MIYIRTPQIPAFLADEFGERWSIQSVRLWIARQPNEHPLVPDLPGRPGQAALFEPETVRAWKREEIARQVALRIRTRVDRRRRLGLQVPGEEADGR